MWPFFERWVTGDKSDHHINDRPRNAPSAPATGVAAIVFYGVLWAEGANDVIADHLPHPAIHDHLDRPGAGLRGPGRRVT